MNSTADRLAQRFAAELGNDSVDADPAQLASHKIDGQSPALLCRPANEEQLSTALRLCAEHEAAVIPWGGGTAVVLGNAPRRMDVVISTERLARIIDHDHANLTVSVESGVVLAELQRQLANRHQFAPLEPPFPDRATIGGIIAANLNGPRRSYYGSVRDLVIGIKVVLIGGDKIKAGGKVVKNVAGYDMCKLFVGSLGTLGVISEVTIRLAPVPETSDTLVVSGTFADVQQFATELGRTRLLPAAVILRVEGSHRQVAVRLEGFAETVARTERDLNCIAGKLGLKPQLLSSDEHGALWRRIEDFPLQSKLVFRVTVPRAELFPVVQSVSTWENVTIVADTIAGTAWMAAVPNLTAERRFLELASIARDRRGHAIVFSAPVELKREVEVWGEAPPTTSLMRGVKHQFDPNQLLNPGRFLGGF
ncbi:MAG TPA: FAD-binding oxidoreductase [Candidatus Binatia bacterium]